MVWVLRICLGLLVCAYAGWLALPAGEALESGVPLRDVWNGLAPGGSVPAKVAAGLLMSTVLLYAVSGLATASGLTWAPGLFFLGFVGEIALRLAAVSAWTGPLPLTLDLATRAEAVLRPLGLTVETTPLTLAAVLSVGLCILATGVWRGQKGAALTRVWTQQQRPVWA